ncbi:MAG: hypothetical protein O9264_01425 [Leptospira sp.]|nr:hypothetical protein [Leptospira sp.]
MTTIRSMNMIASMALALVTRGAGFWVQRVDLDRTLVVMTFMFVMQMTIM